MPQNTTPSQIITRDDNNAIAFSIYLNEIGRKDHNPLSIKEETSLYSGAKIGDPKAINKLVSANLRFVISYAKKYQGRGLNLSDLIQEGNLGLVKAIKPFDETRGFKFYSYAVGWMKESILKSLDENSRMVRLPQNQISSIRKKRKKLILEEEQEVCEEFSLKAIRDSYAEEAFEQNYIPIGVKSNYDNSKPFDVGCEDDFYSDIHRNDIKSFVQNEVLPLLREEAKDVLMRWANGEKLNEKEMQLKMYSLTRLKKQIKKEKLLEYLSY